MQLVLGAGMLRVHGKADLVSSDAVPELRRYVGPCLPRRRKVIRRFGLEQEGTLNSTNGLGWDQEEMRAAFDVGQHCVALCGMSRIRQGKACARSGSLILQPMRHALVLHNVP